MICRNYSQLGALERPILTYVFTEVRQAIASFIKVVTDSVIACQVLLN